MASRLPTTTPLSKEIASQSFTSASSMSLQKLFRKAFKVFKARLRTQSGNRKSISAYIFCICLVVAAVTTLLLSRVNSNDTEVWSEEGLGALTHGQNGSEQNTANAHKHTFDKGIIDTARKIWRFDQSSVPKGPWDIIKDDVAIAVKTGHEVASKRLKKLRETGWLSIGRAVPNILVISDKDDAENGVIGIKRYAVDIMKDFLVNTTNRHYLKNRSVFLHHWFSRQGWRGDKDKNLPIFHLLRKTFPNKKWYLLLDDDTYIFLDNFAKYALDERKNQVPVYTGKVFYISSCGGFSRTGAPVGNPKGEKGLFAHGGSGIFVNQMAMNAMFPLIPKCIGKYSSCWAGDMQVGLCMRDAGVRVFNFHRGRSHEYQFTPFWPSRALADSRYIRRWRSFTRPITFHKVPEVEQYLMSEFESMCVNNGTDVTYAPLRKHLQGHGIQPTYSKKSRYDTFVFADKRLLSA